MLYDWSKPTFADRLSYIVTRVFSGKDIANSEWNRKHDRGYIEMMNKQEEDWNKIYDQLLKTGRLEKIKDEEYAKKYVYYQLFENEEPPPYWLLIATLTKGMEIKYEKAKDFKEIQGLKDKTLLTTVKGNSNYGTLPQVTAEKWDKIERSYDWNTSQYGYKPVWTEDQKLLVEEKFGPNKNSELYKFTKNGVAA